MNGKPFGSWLKSYQWMAGACIGAAAILYKIGYKRFALVVFAIGLLVIFLGAASMAIPAVRGVPRLISHIKRKWYWYLMILPFVALGAYVVYDLTYWDITARLADMGLVWRQSKHEHYSGSDDFAFNFTLANKTSDQMYLNEVRYSLSPAIEEVYPTPLRAARVSVFSDKITARLFLDGGSPKVEALARRGRILQFHTDSEGRLIFGPGRIMFGPKEEADFSLKLVILEPKDELLKRTRELHVQFTLLFDYEKTGAPEQEISAFSILGIGPQWEKEKLLPGPVILYHY